MLLKIIPLPANNFIPRIPAWEKFLNSRMPFFVCLSNSLCACVYQTYGLLPAHTSKLTIVEVLRVLQ